MTNYHRLLHYIDHTSLFAYSTIALLPTKQVSADREEMTEARYVTFSLLIFAFFMLLSRSTATALALRQPATSSSNDSSSKGRRQTLGKLTTLASGAVSLALVSPALIPAPALAVPLIPVPQAITTVVLDSADMQIGVELYDVTIGSGPPQTFPAVKNVNPSGVAASAKVQPGMIVLGNYKEASKSVVSRIKNGPYPIALQFYNLGLVGDYQDAPVAPQVALAAAEQASKEAAAVKGPPLSAKGTGLVTKRIQKPTTPCPDKETRVRRGDTLEIKYEARVASPGGPIYDSSAERGKSVTFTVGAGEVVNGVDVGVYDMCPGESMLPKIVLYCNLIPYMGHLTNRLSFRCILNRVVSTNNGHSFGPRLWSCWFQCL